ncbi:MAG: hypothetical protein JST48_07250 [Bacteroidetes bacterium]|nr:hypothetical protein [Bacteroidota bacterium]
MNLHYIGPFLSFIILSIICSCSTTKNLQLQFGKSSCTPQRSRQFSERDIPKPLYNIDIDTALSSRISFSSLNVANAIGILDLLSDYVTEIKLHRNQQNFANKLTLFEMHLKMSQRIDRASLEVSSVTSELDCEEEKIAQIADYLNGKEGENETRLTAAAIATGAAGAIISEILLNNNNQGNHNLETIGIASGITEATLGLMILLNKKKTDFSHPRNALREIWEGRDVSEIFPPFIWYYLNYYDPNKPNDLSIRNQIIERWMSFKQIGSANSKKKHQLIGLYFGNGGRYSTEQLYNRANMYDQLESYIKLIKQDLTLLAIELEKIK